MTVKVYNINYGYNRELMEACQTMKEYALLIAKVKMYLLESEKVFEATDYKVRLTYAIHEAIEECIREGILVGLLKSRRDEVKEIMLTEYDEEAVLKMIGEEKYEDGFEAGIQQGIEKGIIQVVENMLDQSYSWKQIEEMTGMSEERWNKEGLVKGMDA